MRGWDGCVGRRSDEKCARAKLDADMENVRGFLLKACYTKQMGIAVGFGLRAIV